MIKTVVDTSVLISLLNSEDREGIDAEKLLARTGTEGGIFINHVIYSELSVYFEDNEKLDLFIEDTEIQIESLNPEAAKTAGKRFAEYLENRPEKFQCPECGEQTDIRCSGCGKALNSRQHIASDFLIGAHAAEQADRLATLDTGFHRKYFKKLNIIPE